MNNITTMFQNAVNHYRKQEDLEECVLKENLSYLFFDNYDGYSFVINKVDEIEPKEYFLRREDDSIMELDNNTYSQLLNLDELNNVLKKVDKKMFFNLNEVLIILNEAELGVYEEYLNRELLEDTYGQATSDTKKIAIKFFELLNDVNEVVDNPEDYFNTVVYQFYITLFHELGHISLNYELLNSKYSPLSDIAHFYDNEEDLVEDYSRQIFENLNETTDVFSVFNKDYILSYCKK